MIKLQTTQKRRDACTHTQRERGRRRQTDRQTHTHTHTEEVTEKDGER